MFSVFLQSCKQFVSPSQQISWSQRWQHKAVLFCLVLFIMDWLLLLLHMNCLLRSHKLHFSSNFSIHLIINRQDSEPLNLEITLFVSFFIPTPDENDWFFLVNVLCYTGIHYQYSTINLRWEENIFSYCSCQTIHSLSGVSFDTDQYVHCFQLFTNIHVHCFYQTFKLR